MRNPIEPVSKGQSSLKPEVKGYCLSAKQEDDLLNAILIIGEVAVLHILTVVYLLPIHLGSLFLQV